MLLGGGLTPSLKSRLPALAGGGASAVLLFNAKSTIVVNASDTFLSLLAEVSRYGIADCESHHSLAARSDTMRDSAGTSALLPSSTKGKASGFVGAAYTTCTSCRHAFNCKL